ncbi:hypothetical protein Hanom_Chr16g01468831 [Helianthus anomalus]
MTDASLRRDSLKGAFTHVEVERLRLSGRKNLYKQYALYLVSAAATGNDIPHDWYSFAKKRRNTIRAAQERLAKEKSDSEAYNKTEEPLLSWQWRKPTLRAILLLRQ